MDGKLDVINRSRQLKKNNAKSIKADAHRTPHLWKWIRLLAILKYGELSSLSPALTHTTMQKYDQSRSYNYKLLYNDQQVIFGNYNLGVYARLLIE